MTAPLVVFATLLGLIFGSFATMAAHRIPLRASLNGRSKCPECGHTITAAENVPVLSYLIQRGRCRHCGAKISLRYPLIELLTAILFALAALKFGPSLEAAIYAAFFWVLVILSVIDLDHRLLPDRIVFPALGVGTLLLVLEATIRGVFGGISAVVVSSTAAALALLWFLFPRRPASEANDVSPMWGTVTVRRTSVWLPALLLILGWSGLLVLALGSGRQESLSGAVVGAALFTGFFFAVALLVPNGMMWGDVKLCLLLGTFLGYLGAPELVLVAMYTAFLVGSLAGVVFAWLTGGGGKTAIPFGPFLALGAVVAVLIGEHVTHLYGGLVLK